jgi:hypothetical protein
MRLAHSVPDRPPRAFEHDPRGPTTFPGDPQGVIRATFKPLSTQATGLLT